MTMHTDRPTNRANFSRTPHSEHLQRPMGSRAVGNAVRVGRSERQSSEQLPPVAEKILQNVHGIIGTRLKEAHQTATEQLSRLDLIKRAFVLQSHHLEGPEREDWTTSRLTAELMAKAVLFSPTASEAERSRDKWRLAQFNDMLMDCATCISPAAAKAFTPMMKAEINNFSQQAGIAPDITANDGIEIRMAGIAPEVGAIRALNTDPSVQVTPSSIDQDLHGIDFVVRQDDKILGIDLKRKNPYSAKVEAMYESSDLTFDQYQHALNHGYVFAGRAGDKFPQYIVDAGRFGKLEGFDYDQKGQDKVIATVHRVLAAQFGAS